MGELITEIFAHGAKELLRGTTELVEVELELGLLCLNGGVGEQDGRSEEPNRVRERLLLGGLGGLVLGGKGGVRLHLTDLQSDTIEDLRIKLSIYSQERSHSYDFNNEEFSINAKSIFIEIRQIKSSCNLTIFLTIWITK